MSPLRLFLGIPIPEEFNRGFDHFEQRNQILPDVRWVPRANRHITVYFFGGVKQEMLSNLEAMLEIALRGSNAYELVFEKYSYGPSPQSPRMLWGRFHKTEAFRLMVGRIHELFLQINPNQQIRKSPLPHVTLARLRAEGSLKDIHWEDVFLEKKLSVKELYLWESTLSPSGAEYKLIRQFQLS